jgi:hypothetical protein
MAPSDRQTSRASFTFTACLLVLALAQAFAPVAARAVTQITLQARLQPERIGLGETATLSIEARTGLSRLDLRPSFALENLEIVAGPSQADEMRVENGLFSRTVRLSWQVRPLGVGPARAHSIRVELGGRIIGLPTQSIQVQQEPTGESGGQDESPFAADDPFERLFGPMPWQRPAAPRAPGPNEPPLAFLRGEVSNDHPFVNQQVLYTIYLYSRIEVSAVNPLSTPDLNGFWARDVALPERLPTEIVALGDVRYGRVPLLRKILFPLRAGTHVLEPVRFQIATTQYERGFFAAPFPRPMATELETPALRLDVRPLPAGPPGYEGAVGPLALSASLEPRVLRVAEAATLKVRLAGIGNLQGLPAPDLALPAGLRSFPPHESGSDRANGAGLRSERVWTYVVIPDRPGSFQVSPPAVSYFDPAAASFARAESPPLVLEARAPAPAAAAPLGLHPGRSARQAAAGTAGGGAPGRRSALDSAKSALAAPGALPWAIGASGLLALLSGIAWAKRAGPRADEAGRRFKAEISDALAEERPRRTAVLVESAWSRLLAARWHLEVPPPGSAWQTEAARRGVAPALKVELGRIADDLHFLRTAPQLSSAEALRDEIVERSLRLAAELSRSRGHLLSSVLKQPGSRVDRGTTSRPWLRSPELSIPSGSSGGATRDAPAGSEPARSGLP